jgi:chromosome segregation ATPase
LEQVNVALAKQLAQLANELTHLLQHGQATMLVALPTPAAASNKAIVPPSDHVQAIASDLCAQINAALSDVARWTHAQVQAHKLESARCQQATQECDTLRQSLDAVRRECSALQARISHETTATSRAQSLWSSAKEVAGEEQLAVAKVEQHFMQELANERAFSKSLVTELDEQKCLARELQDKLQSSLQATHELECIVEQLKTERTRSESTCSELNQKHRRFEHQLETMQTALSQLHSEKLDIEQDLTQQIEDLQDEVERVTAVNTAALQRIRHLAELAAESHELREQVDTLTSKLADAQIQNDIQRQVFEKEKMILLEHSAQDSQALLFTAQHQQQQQQSPRQLAMDKTPTRAT